MTTIDEKTKAEIEEIQQQSTARRRLLLVRTGPESARGEACYARRIYEKLKGLAIG